MSIRFYGLTFNSIAIFKTITLNANVNLVFVERVIIFLKNVDFYWFIVSQVCDLCYYNYVK